MLMIAAAWISVLLVGGGLALDQTLTGLVTRNFDEQLGYMLTAMVASAEIGPDGEIFFNRSLGDQRFLEPNSGLYWQISGQGHEDFPSRSLWDRSLRTDLDDNYVEPKIDDSDQFEGERLRIIKRSVILPGSNTLWEFQVAASRGEIDSQIRRIRSILIWSFLALGLGLVGMAGLQTYYGLGPLRRVRKAIARMREGEASRVTEPLPLEVQPLVIELNGLLEHSERQAEEARTHAGNLAHALKTPLTVVMNAATAKADDLSDTVIREAAVMRRQVDHHLARARAVGRRAGGQSRAQVGDSVEAVLRAVTRLYERTRFDYRVMWNRRRRDVAVHFGYYDEHADRHADTLDNMNRVLADLAGIQPGERVLDLGFGEPKLRHDSWSLSQLLQHLAQSIEYLMQGYPEMKGAVLVESCFAAPSPGQTLMVKAEIPDGDQARIRLRKTDAQLSELATARGIGRRDTEGDADNPGNGFLGLEGAEEPGVARRPSRVRRCERRAAGMGPMRRWGASPAAAGACRRRLQ